MDTNKTPPEGRAGSKKPRLTAMERLAIETGLDAECGFRRERQGIWALTRSENQRTPMSHPRSHPNTARTSRKAISLTNSEQLNAKSVKVNTHPKVNAPKLWAITLSFHQNLFFFAVSWQHNVINAECVTHAYLVCPSDTFFLQYAPRAVLAIRSRYGEPPSRRLFPL